MTDADGRADASRSSRGQPGLRIGDVQAQARRPRPWSEARSPSACAAMSVPNALRPAGDRQVLRRIGGDLEEDPGVRAALVQLPGRVQEARAEAERRGRAGCRADAARGWPAGGASTARVLRQVGEDREVVEPGPREAEQLRERAVDGHRHVPQRLPGRR